MKLRHAFIDFETFWSREHTLKKLNPIQYVMHPETEIISCAIQIDDYPVDVIFGEREVIRTLNRLDWSTIIAVGHNMSDFDALLLAWRIKVRPALYACTLAMARPVYGKVCPLSLDSLLRHTGLGSKDNAALVQTMGKHLEDFTPAELEAMEVYNREDTIGCHKLFDHLRPHYSAAEMFHMDCNIRMLVDPQFEVDRGLLQTAQSVERDRKRQALLDLAKQLRAGEGEDSFWDSDEETITEFVRGELASAPKFSAILESRGVEVPMKPSPTNPEKLTPALAKTDEAFQALADHEDPLVAAAARARLAVKSTLLETRIQAFLDTSELVDGRLPVPLRYCGADTTGRDSGALYNPQNLPRIGSSPKPSDALRRCLRAPKGYVVGVADQSGIELRVNHTLWKEPDTMAAYAASPTADLYRDFAAFYYAKRPEEVEKGERQFGKVCIAEGQLVLTSRGLKPIESVSVLDLVWDGVEWVRHDGPVYMGEKDTITYDGLEATPDHEVWVEDGRKLPLADAAAEGARLARTGDGWSPMGFGGTIVDRTQADPRAPRGVCTVHSVRDDQVDLVRQPAGRTNTRLPVLLTEVRGARVAVATTGGGAAAVHESERPSVLSLWGEGGHVRFSDRCGGGGVGHAQPGPAEGPGAGPRGQRQGVRAGESSVGVAPAEHGEPTGIEGSPLSPLPGESPRDTVRRLDSAQLDAAGAYRRGDRRAVSPPIRQTKRRVWDILNAGPRHRFTVSGRLVSNCQLGLGFGAGAKTFQRIARLMGNIALSEAEASNAVTGWRTRYSRIATGWKTCGEALNLIAQGVRADVDPWGMVTTEAGGLRLPSGRMIRYPELEYVDEGQKWPDGRSKKSWKYGVGRHRAYLTGPKVDENIVQALARDSVFEAALRFFKLSRMRPVMRVHDELIYVFPKSEAQSLLDELQKILRSPPSWWPELITWSEGDLAETYGDAK